MKFVIFALALALNIAPASAADEGSAAITAMGEINGVALACQQMAIASRARNAITTTAPKTRGNGEIFEESTNASFLDFGKSKKTCPDTAILVQRLTDAEKRLSAAFPKP
jgi:hypothetical protein